MGFRHGLLSARDKPQDRNQFRGPPDLKIHGRESYLHATEINYNFSWSISMIVPEITEPSFNNSILLSANNSYDSSC